MRINPRGDPNVKYHTLIDILRDYIDRIDLLWCLELAKEEGSTRIKFNLYCISDREEELSTIELTINPYLEDIVDLKVILPSNTITYTEFLGMKGLVEDLIKDIIISRDNVQIQLKIEQEHLLRLRSFIKILENIKKCKRLIITCTTVMED